MNDRNAAVAAGRHTASAGTRARQRGFSLLELVVVIGIVATLAAVFLAQVPVWQARAETVAMEHVVGSLRSALTIKVAQLIAHGNAAGIRSLAGSNPMERLAERPANYIGVLSAVEAAGINGGVWYFDRHGRTLVYRVRHEAYFSGGLSDPARARFVVRPVYEQSSRQRHDHVAGVRLAPVEPYAWRREPVASN